MNADDRSARALVVPQKFDLMAPDSNMPREPVQRSCHHSHKSISAEAWGAFRSLRIRVEQPIVVLHCARRREGNVRSALARMRKYWWVVANAQLQFELHQLRLQHRRTQGSAVMQLTISMLAITNDKLRRKPMDPGWTPTLKYILLV